MIATHSWSDDTSSWYVQTDGTSIETLCTDSAYEAEVVALTPTQARAFAAALAAAADAIDPPTDAEPPVEEEYEYRRIRDGAVLYRARSFTPPRPGDWPYDDPFEIWRMHGAAPAVKVWPEP